jgi:hypothetical protein
LNIGTSNTRKKRRNTTELRSGTREAYAETATGSELRLAAAALVGNTERHGE